MRASSEFMLKVRNEEMELKGNIQVLGNTADSLEVEMVTLFIRSIPLP